MSNRGKTLLKGHTLRSEGNALGRNFDLSGPGAGGCSCGARSPELKNRAARKQWHKEHKAEVVANLKP